MFTSFCLTFLLSFNGTLGRLVAVKNLIIMGVGLHYLSTLNYYRSPVFPIDWNRQTVLQDDRCVRLNEWNVSKMFIEEEDKEIGFPKRVIMDVEIEQKTRN